MAAIDGWNSAHTPPGQGGKAAGAPARGRHNITPDMMEAWLNGE